MRNAAIERNTAETNIKLTFSLDGDGKSNINTGCGFLDHMLTLFAAHSGFDLDVNCVGDVNVDYHHSVEDIGIAFGQAFRSAIGDCKGIKRYGSIILPMDEALVICAVDVSGRGHLQYGLNIPSEKIGDFDSELIEEFFIGFTRKAGVTLHIKQLDGRNSHHIAEAAFKGFAHALASACAIDKCNSDKIPSTKGVL